MTDVLKWISSNPATAAAVISAAGALLGGFFTSLVWPALKSCLLSGARLFAAQRSRRATEKEYLRYLINAHRYLPVLPTTLVPLATGEHRQELDRLYISLRVSPTQPGSDLLGLDAMLSDPQNNRLLIVGEPGSGKTTLLRFLALTFARARLGHASASAIDQEAERQKIASARRRVREEFGYSRTFPLPIFLSLNPLQALPQSTSLLDIIRSELNRPLPSSLNQSSQLVDDCIECGSCIFLLDGFDELPTEDARAQFASLIGELADAAPKGNRFLVTSRIVSYRGQLERHGFRVVTIDPLTYPQILELVQRWYSSIGHPELVTQLITAFNENEHIGELAANPMLLSLIVLVQYVRRLIPKQRHLLYQECVKILVERRYATPAVQGIYNRVLPSAGAMQLLQYIAFVLHNMHLRDVPRAELLRNTIPRGMATMSLSTADGVTPDGLLANIQERSELLVERGFDANGGPLIAFSHLTFQEYLSAAYLFDLALTEGEPCASEKVLGLYLTDPQWWEEVALLYAAQLQPNQRSSFLEQLLPDTRRSQKA